MHTDVIKLKVQGNGSENLEGLQLHTVGRDTPPLAPSTLQSHWWWLPLLPVCHSEKQKWWSCPAHLPAAAQSSLGLFRQVPFLSADPAPGGEM